MKRVIDDMALFGGPPTFRRVRSVSNLLRPDVEVYLNYCKTIYRTKQLTDNGTLVRQLEKRLAELHGTTHCVTFCSGFIALQIAMRLCSMPQRTEVIMPSLTYRRMADIAAWAGLVPHFCDVERDTLGISPRAAAKAVNKNTALILGVHPITNLADIDGLEALSLDSGIPLLFDSVEAGYAAYCGKRVGGFGVAEVFSVHASKLLNGFEGGYATTNDGGLAQELRSVCDNGRRNRSETLRLGLNGRMNELHAAMTLACLDSLSEHLEQNRARHGAWREALADISSLELQPYGEERRGYKNVLVRCKESWPMTRSSTLQVLHAENILARPYYNPPLHLTKRSFPTVCDDLTATEQITEQYLLLPCGDHVSVSDISKIGELLGFLYQHGAEMQKRTEVEFS